MTVKELIEKLEEYDPSRDVIVGVNVRNGHIEYVKMVSSLDDDGAFFTIIGE